MKFQTPSVAQASTPVEKLIYRLRTNLKKKRETKYQKRIRGEFQNLW